MRYALFFVRFFKERKVNKMQFCKDCNIKMKGVVSFSKDKHEKFDRCNKCFGETKHRKLTDDELDFGEVLDKQLKK